MKPSGQLRLGRAGAHNLSVVISCLSVLSAGARPLQPCQEPTVVPNVYRATEPPAQE